MKVILVLHSLYLSVPEIGRGRAEHRRCDAAHNVSSHGGLSLLPTCYHSLGLLASVSTENCGPMYKPALRGTLTANVTLHLTAILFVSCRESNETKFRYPTTTHPTSSVLRVSFFPPHLPYNHSLAVP